MVHAYNMERNTLLIGGTPIGAALAQCCLLFGVKCLITSESPQGFGFGDLNDQHFGFVGEHLWMNCQKLRIAHPEIVIPCHGILVDLAQEGARNFCLRLRREGHNIPVQLLTPLSSLAEELRLFPSTARLIDLVRYMVNPPAASNTYLPATAELLITEIRKQHTIVDYLMKNFPNNREEAGRVLNHVKTMDKEIGELVTRFCEQVGCVYEAFLQLRPALTQIRLFS